MTRAKSGAAYTRYSTNRQTENSIQYQLTQILRYCSDNGISIVATYTDEGRGRAKPQLRAH